MSVSLSELRRWFVGHVYADHNRTDAVRRALGGCLERLGPGEVGLNVGAGRTRAHPALINYDLIPGDVIDCVGRAERLPFADDAFALVVTQETLEHVRDPFTSVREIGRVLRRGGRLYCQVPFVIGYHPGPTDFWRFTREGIRALVEQAGLDCETVALAVGPATGFYRILVEFAATATARLVPRSYPVAKGTFALMFYPLKWADGILTRCAQADRIAGGYYLVARKP